MRVVLLNTHSVLNSGDAAIVAAEAKFFRDLLGNVQIVATSRTPDRDRSFFHGLGVEVLPPLFPAPSTWGSTGQRALGCARNLASLRAKRRLFHAIAAADLVLSSGGGYFFSNRRFVPGPMFLQAYCHVRLAQRLGKPVLFAAQSFGPLASRLAGALLRRLLAHACILRVFVREGKSLEFLHSLLGRGRVAERVGVSPDLAFAFEPDHGTPVQADIQGLQRPILVVSVREWTFPECRGAAERRDRREAYLAGVTETCRSFQTRHGGSILVVPQARGPGRLEDDRVVSQELVQRLGEGVPPGQVRLASVAEEAPPERVFALVAAADLVLATRFHSAIFACLAGKPFVALGYQPKTAGIMAMLGLEEFAVPIAEASTERLFPLLDRLLRQRQAVVDDRLRPATSRLAETARAGLRAAIPPDLPGSSR